MWLSSLNIFEGNQFLWDKKEKHWTQLICIRRWKWVRINSKNEKHFSKRLNIQVCELLQVLTEADIVKNMCKEDHF